MKEDLPFNSRLFVKSNYDSGFALRGRFRGQTTVKMRLTFETGLPF